MMRFPSLATKFSILRIQKLHVASIQQSTEFLVLQRHASAVFPISITREMRSPFRKKVKNSVIRKVRVGYMIWTSWYICGHLTDKLSKLYNNLSAYLPELSLHWRSLNISAYRIPD
jgi:hypothetical protein